MAKGITETAKNAGFPEGMTFEQMKEQIAEFNRLNKLVKVAKKTLSKEDQKKIGITGKGKKRELSEAIKPFIKKVFKLIVEYQDTILEEFEGTKTEDKPDGQKWLTFKSDEGITFCVNRYLKPDEETEDEETEDKE